MSEESENTGSASGMAAEKGMTAGMLLRQAREASGLHVAALAVSMKVPVKKLEALESDRLHELPDAVFARALAASVCRTLKIDPLPILSKLPQSSAPKLDQDERGINMPFQSPGLFQGGSLSALLAKPSVMLVLALLVAAFVVMFFPETHSANPVEADVAKANALPSEGGIPAPEQRLVAKEASPEVTPAVAASAVATASEPAKTAAPVSTKAQTPGIVGFKATSSAWVRVADSKGIVQFEKTLGAGESGEASGELPLSVVVGNVGGTVVQVRGQPFPLDSLAKNNVARFEVK